MNILQCSALAWKEITEYRYLFTYGYKQKLYLINLTLCCSAFEQGNRNYQANQRPRSLMKKERLHIPSNTSTILLDKLSTQQKDTNSNIPQ